MGNSCSTTEERQSIIFEESKGQFFMDDTEAYDNLKKSRNLKHSHLSDRKLKSQDIENNKKLIGDKFDPNNDPFQSNPDTKSYHVIDFKNLDKYNQNDPFQFSHQEIATITQKSDNDKITRVTLKMNQGDMNKIQDLELRENPKAPVKAMEMLKYSDKAMETIQHIIPSIISVMEAFPHNPNEKLHTEMTSIRNYAPPLPDQEIFEELSTSPLEEVKIEPGQHYNYSDPCQILTRGKPVPTWEYQYQNIIPVELVGIQSSYANLESRTIRSTYQGMFRKGKKHGIGHEILETGSGYFGEFQDGIRQGEGRVVLSNGSFYIGEFENNLANGKGVFFNAQTNIRYEGEFKNNTQHGKGIEYYPDHTIYQGDFVSNKKHGKGIFKFRDGAIYEGDWQNNDITGKGKYNYAVDNKWYIGEWKNNLKHGKGKYYMGDSKGGALYDGDFKNGIMEGNAVVTWKNGRKYEGPFVKGKMHGIGKYWKANHKQGTLGITDEWIEGIRKGINDPKIDNEPSVIYKPTKQISVFQI